ncbi:MAG: transcriptional regulator [Spirochaetes bacterium]|nr:MAG: transcriptional regulator [Spirochaetota bacterium]
MFCIKTSLYVHIGVVLEDLLTVAKALADETRLRILNILFHGEYCVCNLQKILDMSEPRVSRHVKILYTAGLLEARKDGKWIYYSPKYTEENRILFTYLNCKYAKEQSFLNDLKAGLSKNKTCSV